MPQNAESVGKKAAVSTEKIYLLNLIVQEFLPYTNKKLQEVGIACFHVAN